ncbi:hypothetical protein AB0B15_42990 [Streptomyces sp. NPDC045456]|uniref:hypothetical protein n=1 Tax=Streptomyces sp. NPDC045456 TaxID=3155254 RepID=UPI0033F89F96
MITPPPPTDPPTVHLQQPDEGDWFDRLYADADLAPSRPGPDEERWHQVDDEVDEPVDTAPYAYAEASTPSWLLSWRDSMLSGLRPRTLVLLYNGGAAALGWAFGLVPAMRDGLYAAGAASSVNAAVLLAVGGIALIGQFWDRRTRRWWGPLPWLCRVPLASAVLSLALYAPAASHA